ncbi:DUF6251 family protein [Streptomyces brasiliensis]|uniref:Uncharacterized protein n=1 Tax=Streptomyces brasiliensis TaxID=1954 RepID=A0A917KJJ5_9ACTN|nr:DUF6251 family protein [Streptomyces brasiliensis]GGJ14465.1 hypothetical protein GCM10010121_026350 [Streptomyces brasiliensis]
MEQLPAPRTVVQLPDGRHAYIDPHALPAQQQAPQVVHIHQAAPDRTVQRIALGAGVGAGAVGASVYFAPMLIAAITSMAISLIAIAVVIVVAGWAIVTVVRSVGGSEGQAAAKTLTGARGRRGRR